MKDRVSGALRGLVLIAALLVVVAGLAQAGWRQVAVESFEQDRLTVVTEDGERHDFRVELARTPEQQSQGLMYRRSLDADAGMLFVYRPPRHVSMWMKNTLIPLDMLFIDADGRVVRVAERTVPMSTETIESGRRVKGVLELNGGTADRLGIEPGARILHPAFGAAE
jgi:uncharacterized membrane protein (UPF0127 family)